MSSLVKKILIVEDEGLIREGLKIALEMEGFQVTVAEDGRMGLILFEKIMPDVVVTDIIMPERDGIELILGMKKLSKNIKIIAISGGGRISANDHLSIAGLLGADATLTKPFSAERLIQEIRKIIE
jgi:DNA-binding response OmpR family regulator